MRFKPFIAALVLAGNLPAAQAQTAQTTQGQPVYSQGQGQTSGTQVPPGYPTPTRRYAVGGMGGMQMYRRRVAAPSYQSGQQGDRQAQAAAVNYSRQTGVSTYGGTQSQTGVNTYAQASVAAGAVRPVSASAAAAARMSPAGVTNRKGSTQQAASASAHDYVDSIISGGVRRTFCVHLPAVASKTHAIPLVFVFHGMGMTGQQMMLMSSMDGYGDRDGFAVVYPDGLGRRWNLGPSDVEFVHDMIGRVASTVNIDRRRVYAAGISNGGHFAMHLACVSNDVAAVAVVAASMLAGSTAASGSGHVPIIFFLGTDDPLVPSNEADHNSELGKLGDALGMGGMGSFSTGTAKMAGFMTLEETVDFWCRRNGCSGSPAVQQMPDRAPNDGTRVTRYSYGGGSNEVVLYRISGGGHSWPGSFWSGAASDVLGRTSDDISASELMSDFFMHH